MPIDGAVAPPALAVALHSHADTPRILILEPFVVHVATQSAPLDDIMFPPQVVALGDRLTHFTTVCAFGIMEIMPIMAADISVLCMMFFLSFWLFVVENHRLFSAKMGIKKSQKIGIFEMNKKATIISGLFSAFIY